MVGDQYLERGKPVRLLVMYFGDRQRAALLPPSLRIFGIDIVGAKEHGPRNCIIQREDGSLVARPFRGLRKPKPVKKIAQLRETRRMR